MKIGDLHDEPFRYVLDHLKPDDVRDIEALHPFDAEQVISFLKLLNRVGWCFYLDTGEPVAVVGGYVIHPGVGHAFLLSTSKLPEITTSFARTQRRLWPAIMENMNLHRLETTVLADRHDAHRWLEFLGAERESVRAAYGINGEDFLVYRWIKRR
jgi:hypothetical protein